MGLGKVGHNATQLLRLALNFHLLHHNTNEACAINWKIDIKQSHQYKYTFIGSARVVLEATESVTEAD